MSRWAAPRGQSGHGGAISRGAARLTASVSSPGDRRDERVVAAERQALRLLALRSSALGEQIEVGLIPAMFHHVQRTLPLVVLDGRVRAIAKHHLDVGLVAVLLDKQMQRCHAPRVLEIRVRAVAQQPLGAGEAAPFDGAEKRGLVLRDRSTLAPFSTSKSMA